MWENWGKSLATKTSDLSLIIGTQERGRLDYHNVVFALCPSHMKRSMRNPVPSPPQHTQAINKYFKKDT